MVNKMRGEGPRTLGELVRRPGDLARGLSPQNGRRVIKARMRTSAVYADVARRAAEANGRIGKLAQSGLLSVPEALNLGRRYRLIAARVSLAEEVAFPTRKTDRLENALDPGWYGIADQLLGAPFRIGGAEPATDVGHMLEELERDLDRLEGLELPPGPSITTVPAGTVVVASAPSDARSPSGDEFEGTRRGGPETFELRAPLSPRASPEDLALHISNNGMAIDIDHLRRRVAALQARAASELSLPAEALLHEEGRSLVDASARLDHRLSEAHAALAEHGGDPHPLWPGSPIQRANQAVNDLYRRAMRWLELAERGLDALNPSVVRELPVARGEGSEARQAERELLGRALEARRTGRLVEAGELLEAIGRARIVGRGAEAQKLTETNMGSAARVAAERELGRLRSMTGRVRAQADGSGRVSEETVGGLVDLGEALQNLSAEVEDLEALEAELDRLRGVLTGLRQAVSSEIRQAAIEEPEAP